MTIEAQEGERNRPRAPTQAAWDAMSEQERKRALDALPSYIPQVEVASEGDAHFDAKSESKDKLRRFFSRTGRSLYVAAEQAVYYPGETYFVPDLLAVREVETHPRNSWVVSAEGKGIDLIVEILVAGERKKDLEFNARKYASLGVSEYFVFDHAQNKLQGWRLVAENVRLYTPIVPQRGKFFSSVLELELAVQGRKLRFFRGNAELLDANGIIDALEQAMDEQTQIAEERVLAAQESARFERERAEQAEAIVAQEREQRLLLAAEKEAAWSRAEQEKARAEQEKARADRAEKELEALRAELAKKS